MLVVRVECQPQAHQVHERALLQGSPRTLRVGRPRHQEVLQHQAEELIVAMEERKALEAACRAALRRSFLRVR